MNEGDRSLAGLLGSLRPSPPGHGLSVEKVMFAAGRAVERRKARRWQALSGVLGMGLVMALAGFGAASRRGDSRAPVSPEPDHDRPHP